MRVLGSSRLVEVDEVKTGVLVVALVPCCPPSPPHQSFTISKGGRNGERKKKRKEKERMKENKRDKINKEHKAR